MSPFQKRANLPRFRLHHLTLFGFVGFCPCMKKGLILCAAFAVLFGVPLKADDKCEGKTEKSSESNESQEDPKGKHPEKENEKPEDKNDDGKKANKERSGKDE